MYTVPIIAPDLRHEETIIQAARALDCLHQTIDNVFERIDARIAASSKRIDGLGERIETAEQRIRSLVGVKKALQIYAPARFPATHVLCDLPVTFNDENIIHKEQNVHNLENMSAQQEPQYEVQSRVESTAPQALQDKLVFFHVRGATNVKCKGNVPPEYIAETSTKLNSNALGPPPADIRSAATLLRFNSEERAYSSIAATEQSNEQQDNWRRARLFKNQRLSGSLQRKQQQLLEPAPHSLANRNQRATPAGELRYMPKVHEAPSMDLPLDLPTLEGVAQDINFTGLAQFRSSKSITVLNVETPTPTIKQETNIPKVENLTNNLETTTTTTITKTKTTTTTTVAAVAAPPAPPPPPPPPPPPAAAAAAPLSPATNEVNTKSIDNSDSRSALMDAIRKAGGALGGRLRSAAAAPVDALDKKASNLKTKSDATKVASSGDLMADLHHKLLMRRKGISGVNAASNSTNNMSNDNNNREYSMENPVIQRLSALIPPPPAKTSKQTDEDDATNNNEDEDDWQ